MRKFQSLNGMTILLIVFIEGIHLAHKKSCSLKIRTTFFVDFLIFVLDFYSFFLLSLLFLNPYEK